MVRLRRRLVNFTVNDTLPAGIGFISGAGSGWSCSAVGQDVTCLHAGPLASGKFFAVANNQCFS